ncbi:PREDICTED: nuclear pore complex protein Nup160-like [Acropora digitifera]|uniref:nuclear pore complex protein Nup160-like n=1 Tax=Acropora digitifera TaxID=70779 RepID=UPI00077A4B39|nr:PREDICTED: nuclear pore complex protein Nup160-like [Acropora digitifera]
MMQRLWSGLVPSSLRRDVLAADAVVSLTIQPFQKHMCVFALCRDLKLRVWSCQNMACIYVKDLVGDIPDEIDLQVSPAQGHLLRKVVDPSSGQFYLALFLYVGDNTQFCVYEVVPSKDILSLSPVSFKYFAKENLVDFVVTPSHLWTVWTNTEGDAVVYFTALEGGEDSQQGWIRVFLQPTDQFEVHVPPYKEAREVFLEHVFYPGRFSNHSILKAMQIYRHLPDENGSNLDENVSRGDLKHAVINLIDSEIQMSAPDSEMLHDEYSNLQLHCWNKFFSYVVQYHQVSNKAMGIFVDENTGLVSLIRKDILCFLRPCDVFEQLHLSSDPLDISLLSQEPFADKTLKTCFISFCNVLQLVSQQLSADHLSALENDVKYQLNPALTAEQIAISLLTSVSDEEQEDLDGNSLFEFQQELEASLHKVKGVFRCLDFLLRGLDIQGIVRDAEPDAGWSEAYHAMSCGHLFSSELSLSLLSTSSRQIISSRLSVCKQLLVLLSLMPKLNINKIGLDVRTATQVSSVYIPQTVSLLNSFVSLHWIMEQLALPSPSNAVESNLKQLAALEINEGMDSKTLVDDPSLTVAELFLSGIGGKQLRVHLAHIIKTSQEMQDDAPGPLWSTFFNQAVYTLMDLLWPSRQSALFPEFLLSTHQYLHLQEYANLICNWCDTCQSSWHFLVGQSHVVLGEHHKALGYFRKAAKGIGSKDSLMMKVIQSDVEDTQSLLVLFYVKVMKLFEQFDAPEFVIRAAHIALNMALPDDPNICNLWSNIFKHHLELGHYDLAYNALITNPDHVRRRDCLHKFMVVLCERGQTRQLIEYPFINLQDEFEDIVESHARTVDIMTHNYYDMLYAFHVFRGNYRKAGAAMYEHAMRLGQEVSGLDSLQKQAKCYLAAMNALHLVDPKNAWIVKPLDRVNTTFFLLTFRCVKLSHIGSGLTRQAEQDAWDWVLSNDLGEAQVSGYKSVTDQAWQLLKLYLDRLGPCDGYVYYRCVAAKLLSCGAALPTWLVNDYKRFNAPELLRLYINYDLLLEAVLLSVEYIQAALGNGKEYFGLENALHATSPSVWLPYTAIDQLLLLLKDVQLDSELAKARDELKDQLNRFHEQVATVSHDMINAQWRRAQRKSIPVE